MRAVLVTPDRHDHTRRRSGPSVRIADVPAPVPPAPGWVVVRPLLAGICGSDLALIGGELPVPFPATEGVTPGHEVVGVISDARRTRWAKEGQKVIAEPALRCVHKGLPECSRCRAGQGHLCENRDRAGALCSGASLGASLSTGGAWSEAFLAHEDMLLPAKALLDQRAVLAEPCAAALHAVLRWDRRGQHAAVIGRGTLSRLVVAILGWLHPDLDISFIYDGRAHPRSESRFPHHRRHRGRHEADRGPDTAGLKTVGAARVWRNSPDRILQEAADHLGARVLRTGDGAMRLDRGLDVVFDCRGTAASFDLGVRLLRGGGTLVVMGQPQRQAVDLSLVWSRELTIAGATGHGREHDSMRTFSVVSEWLAHPAFPVNGIVTHRFPLEDIQQAVSTASAGASAGAVKVCLASSPVVPRLPALPDIDMDTDGPIFLAAAAARVRR